MTGISSVITYILNTYIMKTNRIKLQINQLVINADGSAVVICESSEYNESGVFKQSAGQLARFVSHTNSFAPQLLSQLIGMPFPSHLEMDVEARKAGDTWESTDGKSSGEYTSDHYGFRNETIALSAIASQTLFTQTANVAIAASMANVNAFAAPVAAAPVAAPVAEVASELNDEKA